MPNHAKTLGLPKSERDIADLYFDKRVSFPFRIICEVTYRCNAKCIHCYAPSPRPYNITELTVDEWKAFFQDMSDLGAFRAIFTGGEPLLREDIFEMIQFSHELGLLTFLETNGSLIDRKNAQRLVDAGINIVNMSINRSTAPKYDAFSGHPGLFNKVINAFQFLNAYDVETAVFTTVNKVNIKEIPDVIDVAATVHADRIAFVHLSPAGRARTNKNLYPSAEEYIEVLKHIHEKDKEYPDLIIKYPNLPAFYFQESIGLDAYEKIKISEGYIELCNAAITVLVVDPEGNIKPCTVTSEKTIGNIKEDSLKDIWLSSPLLEGLRNMKKESETPCTDCELNTICVAGHRCLDYQLQHLMTHDQPIAAPLCEQCYLYMHQKDR